MATMKTMATVKAMRTSVRRTTASSQTTTGTTRTTCSSPSMTPMTTLTHCTCTSTDAWRTCTETARACLFHSWWWHRTPHGSSSERISHSSMVIHMAHPHWLVLPFSTSTSSSFLSPSSSSTSSCSLSSTALSSWQSCAAPLKKRVRTPWTPSLHPHCPLRTDSVSWKITRIIQKIHFVLFFLFLACEFKNSISIFDVSNDEPWNRINSSISLRLFLLASLRSQFCFKNSTREVDDLVEVGRLFDEQTNFFFFRLDDFIQLLKTSSVIICVEFVFSNLCSAMSENLLSLSFQKNPNLFTFRAVARNFSDVWNLWVTWFHDGFLRSIMTDGRRQTGRQIFFLRVIGSSWARIRERLADGDVIVVEVIRGPILDRGFLGVVFISLRDVVVVGLIPCKRLHSARVPRSSLAEVHREFVHHIVEDIKLTGRRKDRVMREKMVRKEKKVESSKTNTWAHEDDSWQVMLARQTHDLSRACACESVRKCDLWGVVLTLPVGCSRLLSAVNNLTATNFKKSWKSTRLRLCAETTQRVSPFCLLLFTWAQLRTFLLIVMSPTRNRSIATKFCWRKNPMMGAIAGISRMELAWVVFLQILGENGVMWSTHRWNRKDFSPDWFFQTYWEIHHFFWYRKCSSCVIR